MKYLLRSWVRRLFSTGSARTIRRSPALQLEALEDRTTPSVVGVKMIQDIATGTAASNPAYFTEVNGVVYFAATDASGDRELWRTDGTTAGTYRVADINNSGSSNPKYLLNVNGTLFFTADNGSGPALWAYDPQTSNLNLVANIIPGPANPVSINGVWYFSADDGSSGYELWSYDSNTSTLSQVADINSGAGSSNPGNLINVNGVLYFTADDGSTGVELWSYDPTTSTLSQVADINNGAGSSYPAYLTDINGVLYFTADDGSTGVELWSYDPTTSTLSQVADINPGAGSSYPTDLININGVLYFAADDGSTGMELWSFDPSASTLTQVADINPSGSSNPADLININGVLYFTADDGSTGVELWSYDPTTSTLAQVADINLGSGSSYPTDLINVNGVLYFTANNGSTGVELWSFDPATSTLTQVADINPSGSSYPSDLININGTLFFAADDGSNGVELWRTTIATTLNVVGGDNQNTTVNTAFTNPLQVEVLDQFNEPMAGVTVTFAAPGSGASATLSSSTATTGSNGQAQVNATANTIAGTYSVTASVGSLTASFTLTNDPDAPAALIIVSGDNQNTTVNTAFGSPLVVEVQDQYGNPVPNVTVTFAAPGSGASATLNSSTATTGSNGQAQVNATANTIAGTYSVTASVGSLSASFTLTNDPDAPAALVIVSGDNQNTTVNTAFGNPLVVQLVDQYGNAVSQSGVSVTFTAPSSGASASFGGNNTITVTTGSNGQASSGAFSANTVAGSYQVQVTSGSLTGVQFSLTNDPDAPAALVIVSGDNQNTTVNTAFGNPLVVQLVDQYGNAVSQSGVSVTFTAPSSGASASFGGNNTITVTTGSNGQASSGAFSANTVAGSYQVQVTSGSLTGVQFNLTNNPDAPAALVIVSGDNQNTTVNTAFGNPLVVQLVDQYGNAVSQSGVSVTFTAPSSGASASFGGNSTITVTTGNNGQASSGAFSANTVAGSYQVQVTSGSLTGVQFNLTNDPDAPAALVIVSGDNQNTTVNTAFGNPLVVQLVDQYGNAVSQSGVSVTFTAPSTGASASFGGNSTITVTTGSNGQASSGAFSANTVAGSYQVQVTSGSLTGVQFNLTNDPDAPAALVIVSGDNQNTTVNTAFGSPLVVQLVDQYGNAVSQSGVSVTFTAPSSGASASFGGNPTITVTTGSNGQASSGAFSANTVAGSYQVQVTSGSLTGVQFNLTNNPDAPAALIIVSGDNQNTTVNTAFGNPLVVQLVDQYGNAVSQSGVSVTFTAPSSGASASFGGNSTITVTTGNNGQASSGAFSANTVAGSYQVQVTSGSLTGVQFNLTNDPDAPAALIIVSGDNQNTTVNTAFGSPLVVQLVDQYGNAVSQSGVSVTFTAPSSGASASFGGNNTITVTTGSNGQASSGVFSANTVAGSYQVQVTSGSLTGVQFSLTNDPDAPAALVIVSGDNQNTTVNTAFGSPLVVEVRDQYGNPVPNVNVTFTAPSSGASALFAGNSTITVTTDANGQATVNVDANTIAGSYAVTATVGSLSVNFALTNEAGPIAAIQFRIQPPTNVGTGQRFRAQVVLLDQYGNVVRRPNTGVRLSLRAGSGLSGTLVKRTSIHGLATFGDLVLSTPGRYRLVARLGNGLQVISRAIQVV